MSDLAVLNGVVRRPAVLTVGLHWACKHPLWWSESDGGDVHRADLDAWGVSDGLADDRAVEQQPRPVGAGLKRGADLRYRRDGGRGAAPAPSWSVDEPDL